MQKKKLKNRTKCFDYIIELCHRRIRTVSSYCGQNTFYEIPGFVVGYPLYNLSECITYIVEALRKNGFLIQILPPPNVSVIYISWDPRELKPQKSLPPPNVSINSSRPPLILQNGLNNTTKNSTVTKVKNPLGYRDQMKLF
jgi:hypothetical protein